MEELYVEGLATRDGPEPCVDVCEGVAKRWTGARAGRAIEPRNDRFGVPTLYKRRKATSSVALARGIGGPRAVGEPWHVRNLHAREPGEPVPARPIDQWAGRPGNAKAVSLG